MKRMKKLLSSLLALSMMAMMSVSFTVSAATSPKMTAAIEGYTGEVGSTFNVVFSYSDVEGLYMNEDTWDELGISSLQFELAMPGKGTNYKGTGAKNAFVCGEYNFLKKASVSVGAGDIMKVSVSLDATDTGYSHDATGSFKIPCKVVAPYEGTTEFKLQNCKVILAAYDSATDKNSTITYTQVDGQLVIDDSAAKIVVGSEPEVTSIDIAGADTVEAEATATYTATVKDADGAEMADETVTWSIKEDTTAATINAETGVLTAGKPDADTTVTVVATSETKAGVSAEKTVTISKYVAQVVDPTIKLTAEEGKDSAAGAYTFFYKAVITAGTEAITAADVTITSGHQSRRAFLSEGMLANIGGGITFYVGNMTADADRTFSAVGTVNGIASDAVDYTTPAE